MRLSTLFAAAIVTFATGGGGEPTMTPANQSKEPRYPLLQGRKGRPHSMNDVQQVIKLKGFDPKGEPLIRVMADGSLQIVFSFMPPSFVPDGERLGPFADFDKQMERAAGVPILWDDREVFMIRQPNPNTVERVQRFIEGYRGK